MLNDVYLESLMGLPEQSVISVMCFHHHSVLSIQSVIGIINLLFEIF